MTSIPEFLSRVHTPNFRPVRLRWPNEPEDEDRVAVPDAVFAPELYETQCSKHLHTERARLRSGDVLRLDGDAFLALAFAGVEHITITCRAARLRWREYRVAVADLWEHALFVVDGSNADPDADGVLLPWWAYIPGELLKEAGEDDE